MSDLSNAERQRLAMIGEMKISETRIAGAATKYIRMWESLDPSIYQRWETMAVVDALNEAGALR